MKYSEDFAQFLALEDLLHNNINVALQFFFLASFLWRSVELSKVDAFLNYSLYTFKTHTHTHAFCLCIHWAQLVLYGIERLRRGTFDIRVELTE